MGRSSESAGCVGDEKKKSVDKKTGVEMMGGYMGEWLSESRSTLMPGLIGG